MLKVNTIIVVVCVTYSTAIITFLVGVVTIAIPATANDLGLPNKLELW